MPKFGLSLTQVVVQHITRAMRPGFMVVSPEGVLCHRCLDEVNLIEFSVLRTWVLQYWHIGFFLTLVEDGRAFEVEMVAPGWARLLGVRLIYGRDQTAARAAWQASRSSKARLAQFLGHLPVPAWVVNTAGEVVATNEAACHPPPCRDECAQPRKVCLESGGFWQVLRMRKDWRYALNQVVLSRQPFTTTASQVACRSWRITLVPLGAGDVVEGVGAVALDITEVDQARAVAEDAVRQMRVLAQHAHRAREDERQDISREIHDHLGQGLTVLMQDIHRMSCRLGAEREALAPLVDDLIHQVGVLVQITRQLSLNLRPEILDHLGLEKAVEQLVTRLRQRMGVRGILTVARPYFDPPPALALHIYRCVQEGLNNILKHSKASRFEVALSIGMAGSVKMYYLVICDNGIGIPMARRNTDRLGLLSLRERVALHAGGFVLRTRPEYAGTELRLSFAPRVELTQSDLLVERRAVDRGSE